MMSKLHQWFSDDVGIDLGTANTLVYLRGRGMIINEPTLAVINEKTGRIVALGHDAKQMIGRTPAHLSVIKPLVNGVISNFEVTEEMLAHLLRRVRSISRRWLFRPRLVVGIPSGITNVEIRAVRDAALNAGARVVHIIEEPMAAALGIRLPVYDPVGHMVVDIGGGTTNIAVISMGGIVSSNNLKVAGEQMNAEIIAYVRDEFKVLIGEKTAEDVKLTLGSAVKQHDIRDMVVRGRDLVAGLPKEVVLTDADIREAIGGSLTVLSEAIKKTLEATPPEVVSDVMHRGIILTGGSSLIVGLPERLRQELRIPVALADDPLTAVVRGTGAVLEDLDRFADILVSEKNELLAK